MSLQETMRAAFDGVNARSPDAIMACWSKNGVYDNPMTGKPARGSEAVRTCMESLVETLTLTGSSLVVDRMTIGERHVVAEWHIEPRDGRRGVHIADFDRHGKLRRVTVYPRK